MEATAVCCCLPARSVAPVNCGQRVVWITNNHRGACRASRRQQRATAAAAGTQPASTAAGREVRELVPPGASLYDATPQLAAAVDRLILQNPSRTPGKDTFELGQGTWQVFHAPHIARLSSLLGARFHPISYHLRGKRLISNVCYSHPLLGSGWLNAAGTLSARDDHTVELHFTQFWWDVGADAMRPELPLPTSNMSSSADNTSSSASSTADNTHSGASSRSSGTSLLQGWADAAVGALGRAAFISSFALFPVLYLDGQGLSVFRFPPLRSNIAVRRVASGLGPDDGR